MTSALGTSLPFANHETDHAPVTSASDNPGTYPHIASLSVQITDITKSSSDSSVALSRKISSIYTIFTSIPFSPTWILVVSPVRLDHAKL